MIGVTGGRNYDDRERLYRVLDEVLLRFPSTVLVHGGANGADLLADLWARDRGLSTLLHLPTLGGLGERLYFLRNQRVVDNLIGEGNVLVSFPGGVGTRDCVRRAKKAGLKVIAAW